MIMLRSAILLVFSLAVPASIVSGACVGDCGGDGAVTVDEIVTGVNIALGTAPLDQCTGFDGNADQQVTVDEILSGVNNALNGCAGLSGAYSAEVTFDATHSGIINLTAHSDGQVSGSVVVTSGSSIFSRFEPSLSFTFPVGGVSVSVVGTYDPVTGGFEVEGNFADGNGQTTPVVISGDLPGPTGSSPVNVYVGTDLFTATLSAGTLATPTPTPTPHPTPAPGSEPRIVYVGSLLDPHIFVINSDGSGVRKLSNGPGTAANPAWSPDGSKIAFAAPDDQNDHVGIAVVNVDGSDLHLLQDPADFFLDGNPAWNPDGNQIMFTGGGGDTIELINANGTGRHQLVHESVGETYGHLSWSPDGGRIAFESTRPQQAGSQSRFEIWVMNADGSNLVQLTNNDLPDRHPDWSPDGQQIIFQRDNTLAGGIMSIKPDGSGEKRLIFDAFGASAPSWSADGQSLAYAGLFGFIITNANGANGKTVPNTGFLKDFDYR